MKPIEQARLDLDASKANGDDDGFFKHMDMVLGVGMKLKKVMVEKKLTRAKTKCLKCEGAESLHGRLLTGPSAGRHARSGGAFRMWCSACDIQMME